ncbi:hypothetical protein B0A48_03386 [Cryoendolithus antarcticus]|uniref:BAH domain-containing protein n=1 Tax=Cryoendolithus antarcticus TaxID=1507870 RepID=A0A1V8TJW6_9PEZI|nr:hypothetical protein B0A48_03386 [Cryoendolithus antarcticus]
MPPGRERRQSARAAAAANTQEVDDRPLKRRRITHGDGAGSLDRPTGVVRPQHSIVIELDSDEDSASPTPAPAHDPSRESQAVDHAPPDLGIVRAYPLAQPSSCFNGWEQPADVELSSEMDALENLLAHLRVQQVGQPEDFDFVELDDFTVYRPPDVRLHHDMCTLSRLQVLGTDKLLFDGTLAVNGHRHFVQGVPFSTLTIDYDDDVRFDTRKRACIQSFRGQRANVWYRLGTPAHEYRRYYNPFNWVATFTALFLEYLEQQGCKLVTLADFRSRFLDWLQASHGSLPEITAWLAQCKLKDFRSSVIANFDYLNKECHSLGLVPVRLWVEVNPADLRAIPKQVNDELKTVVTPFVYDMFKDMYFATHLKQKTASNGLLSEIATRKRSMALTPLNSRPTTLPTVTDVVTVEGRLVIRPGDVVQIPQDPNSTWRGLDAWFVYVQDVRGEHMDVIWLYHSSHTTLDELAYYPFQNELFMSDNCRCGQDAEPIYQVIRKVDVRWFPTDPNSVSQTEFFVRQKYRSVLEDFVTLRSSDFNCECHLDNDIAQWEKCCATYSIGDYVLFREGVSDDHALFRLR